MRGPPLATATLPGRVWLPHRRSFLAVADLPGRRAPTACPATVRRRCSWPGRRAPPPFLAGTRPLWQAAAARSDLLSHPRRGFDHLRLYARLIRCRRHFL